MPGGGNNECSQSPWMWHLGIQFRGECGGAGLLLDLEILEGFSKLNGFCDSSLASTASLDPFPCLLWSGWLQIPLGIRMGMLMQPSRYHGVRSPQPHPQKLHLSSGCFSAHGFDQLRGSEIK